MIIIQELNNKNVQEASRLADAIFIKDPIKPSVYFEASLDDKKFHDVNKISSEDLFSLKYWVAVDDETKRIVGTTGLYEKIQDKDDAAWVDWYCVAPDVRGKKIGSTLLDFTIAEAKKKHKKFLRLYTSTLENESVAQIIYERKGFKIIKEMGYKKEKDYEIFYRQLDLQ